jgi:excisionase family DNA binding protein
MSLQEFFRIDGYEGEKMGSEDKKHPLVVYEPRDLVPILKLSRATIHEMLHNGELPAVLIRQGSRKKVYRIYGDALERWLKNNETKAAGAR